MISADVGQKAVPDRAYSAGDRGHFQQEVEQFGALLEIERGFAAVLPWPLWLARSWRFDDLDAGAGADAAGARRFSHLAESSRVRMPPEALTPMSGSDHLRIKAMSCAVAPLGANPVDVLTKSAPASLASVQATAFSCRPSSAVSMITLRSRPPRGGLGDRAGCRAFTYRWSPERKSADVDHHVDFLGARANGDRRPRPPWPRWRWRPAGSRPRCRPSRECPQARRQPAEPSTDSRRRWRSRTAGPRHKPSRISARVASGLRIVWSIRAAMAGSIARQSGRWTRRGQHRRR